jgi:VWFA-related protein
MKNIKMKKSIIICFQFLVITMVLGAQKVDINLVDTEVYPRIKVYITVTDSMGEVVCKLPHHTFRLTENEEPRKLRVLSGEETYTSIAILLDCSGSMQGVIDNVREAARLFIKLLGGTDRACTYSFDDYLHCLYTMLDVSRGTNKETLMNSLDKYTPGGGTMMYDAIAGLIQQEMAAEKDCKRAIVALTDGVSGGFSQTALNATSKHNVAVYTIGMGDVDPRALRELSEKSGGVFYAVKKNPSKEELETVYRDIKKRLSCQYTLIYETPVCPDGLGLPIKVFVDRLGISKEGSYKRPFHPARIVHNLFFTPKENPGITIVPDDPIECEKVKFYLQLQSTSCSDKIILENIVVRAYDVRPGDRKEVAKSTPVQIQSNGDPRRVVVEWDTRGYTGARNIELVIDPTDEIIEEFEEDNLMKTMVNVSTAVHDLYIEAIDYSPQPASPCKLVEIKVKVGDGCTCKGVKSHDVMLEALDDKKKTFGTSNVTVTSGTPSEVTFSWDPEKRFGHLPFTFKLDPQRQFGQEQTLKNNIMQALIEVLPVLHELSISGVTHPEKRFFVGDEITFNVNVQNAGICPGWDMKQKIRIRLKDADTNRVLAHSELFSLKTQSSIIVKTRWTTNRNDAGTKSLEFIVEPDGKLREQDPPGKTNNAKAHEIEVLPMPHDLIINSVTITPKSPTDGDPAVIKVEVEDNARFPGVRLDKFKIKAFERYSKALLGRANPAEISSQQTIEVEFPIDTGGMAGRQEILIVVDPDNEIEELTPKGLDGENNNEYIIKVEIQEGG